MNKKYEVHLCKECIQELKNHYPYLVPRDQLRIVEVSTAECDNSNLDTYNGKLRQRNPDFEFEEK